MSMMYCYDHDCEYDSDYVSDCSYCLEEESAQDLIDSIEDTWCKWCKKHHYDSWSVWYCNQGNELRELREFNREFSVK